MEDHELSPHLTLGAKQWRPLELVERVRQIAAEKRVTAARLALPWVLCCGGGILPMLGTKLVPYLKENVGALNVELTPDHLEADRRAFPGPARQSGGLS